MIYIHYFNYENCEIIREIDQEGFQISVHCSIKDLISLRRIVKNFRGKISLNLIKFQNETILFNKIAKEFLIRIEKKILVEPI